MRALAARGVPFAFVSDYSMEVADGTPHLGVLTLPKPFTRAVLAAVVERLTKRPTEKSR